MAKIWQKVRVILGNDLGQMRKMAKIGQNTTKSESRNRHKFGKNLKYRKILDLMKSAYIGKTKSESCVKGLIKPPN